MQERCQNAAGDLLKLLIQPGDGVEALLNSINRAKTSVELAIFRFDHKGIEEALTKAVKRGVSVHALIAHVNGSSAEALRKLEMRLLAAGVTVARTDNGLARYHSKFVVIDRRELFVLAFNFTYQDISQSRSFGLITKKRDLVQEAAALFEADNKRQPYKPGAANFVVSPLNARKQLSSFIKRAKSELLIYDPHISDPEMIRLLENRLDANVSVRIIGRLSNKKSRLSIRQLGKMRLHTRLMICDHKTVFIGSQSLRELELDDRREVGLICNDRAVIAGLLHVFEEDWAASEQSKASNGDARPAAKIAKKVAKAFTRELLPVAPVLDEVLKEVTSDGADVNVDPAEIEETVRQEVKDAVKTVVQQVIEQKVEVDSAPDE
jgi:phosphatidylserine/phosphatidylglycerophosphate/cardiolipin synthase-like enzyme